MTAQGRRRSAGWSSWGAALLVVALGGCASRSPAPAPAAGPVSPVPPAPTATAEPAPAPESPAPPTGPRTVVLDSGEEEGEQPRTLLEASRLAKERQKTAGQPIAVITDENLAQYARQGKLTVAKPAAKPDPEAGTPAVAPAEGEGKPSRDEAYWRTTARSLREKWRAAIDAVSELETRAEALRHQFYSEEDVYLRDTRVKPAWDRVLDRLEDAKRDADGGRAGLTDFLEEGRRAGALPGWLREGIELEPEEQRTMDEDMPEAEAVEPVTIDD